MENKKEINDKSFVVRKNPTAFANAKTGKNLSSRESFITHPVRNKQSKELGYVLNTQEMIEAGLNLGPHILNVHPKMKTHIESSMNKFSIINSKIINESFIKVLKFIKEISGEGKTLLLVGTRPQDRKIIQSTGFDCNLPFVNQKWIPGLFTNFKVVLKSVSRLEDLKKTFEENTKIEKKDDIYFDKKEEKKQELKKGYLSKKELAQIKKKIEKLEIKIQGIKAMKSLPVAIFILDSNKEKIAIQEAKKMGIKIIAVVNADADPRVPDYVIFANNRSIISLKYILEQVKKVIQTTNLEAPPIVTR